MKARKKRSTTTLSLNQFLNRRLVSYATAATAAGVGVLGLAQAAHAQIVFTPAHVVIGPRTTYTLDLTNDGTADFILDNSVTANCSTLFDALLVKPVLANAVEGRDFDGFNLANALQQGEKIGPSQHFINPRRAALLMGEAIDSPGGGQLDGNWVNVTNRYLGLQFQINGQTHFGWARFSVKIGLSQGTHSVLTGYAYEAQPNTPISAGQEHGQTDDSMIVPKVKGDAGGSAALVAPAPPGTMSLGLLALGGPGLPLWRSRRFAGAVAS